MFLDHPGPSPSYWVALSSGCKKGHLDGKILYIITDSTGTRSKFSKVPFTLMQPKLPFFVMILSVFSAIAAQASPGLRATVEGRRQHSSNRDSILIVSPAEASSELPPLQGPTIFTGANYEEEE